MTSRREFLYLAPAACAVPGTMEAFQEGNGPAPIAEPHFPSRLYQFVWRNWELANLDRMAQVVHAKPGDLAGIGASMGLPPKRKLTGDQLARLYVTVIRQNWHLLPESQLVALLGWDRDRFSFTLKEDDFLDVKLGPKPACSALRYSKPSPSELSRADEIRQTIREVFKDTLDVPGEQLFAFVETLSSTGYRVLRAPSSIAAGDEVDFTQGWGFAAQDGAANAVRLLRDYLASAMQVKLASDAPKKIQFELRSVANSKPEDFRIAVTDNEVGLSGPTEAALIQAVYYLQDQMEAREAPFLKKGSLERKTQWNPRYLYSYFALYGDPLMDSERSPFPDGYLEKLARCGVNGVWMQAVLNTLAPSKQFPEFGKGWETRLRNLRLMVSRARQFGVRVFLYLNEPRAMPDEFFRKYPHTRGSRYANLHAMCTSVPEVREWLRSSLAHVFQQVPDLGGIFTISMSENHTNCFSHGGAWGDGIPNAGDCPRCSKRSSWETLAELLHTFREGVREHSGDADVIAYDWGWGTALAEKLIPLLDKDVHVLSISEWDAPVNRGGVQTKVGEYSISVVGPGPRATRYWRWAKSNGNPTMAKVQFNNTWEISAVPYVPVMHLILEHCENLQRAGINGVMPSWTCGGYASPNLMAAKSYYHSPRPESIEILRHVATVRYGAAACDEAVEAWRLFSDAFREFPYGVHVYIIPTQHGPANPLRLAPTQYKPGMILFPHDGYKAWSGSYPPEIVQRQFAKMAALWKQGISALESAALKVTSAKKPAAQLDLAIAQTCFSHFQSTANQVEFYILRDKAPADRSALARMREIAEQEMELARLQYPLARRHSVIAYEASNHYYYTPLDLVEKILNCRQTIAEIDRRMKG